MKSNKALVIILELINGMPWEGSVSECIHQSQDNLCAAIVK